MQKNQAIITGITRYFGSNLAKFLLRTGWNMAGIVRPTSNLQQISEIFADIDLHTYDGNVLLLKKILMF